MMINKININQKMNLGSTPQQPTIYQIKLPYTKQDDDKQNKYFCSRPQFLKLWFVLVEQQRPDSGIQHIPLTPKQAQILQKEYLQMGRKCTK
jgi:hypothetical protein